MSALEEKLEARRDTGGKARRCYATLRDARGFRVEEDGRVSISPMGERTYWRHVGGGLWNSAGSEYEKVDS